MATSNVRVVDVLPIITGPAAAVTEVQEAMDRHEARTAEFIDKAYEVFDAIKASVVADIPASVPEVDFELPSFPTITLSPPVSVTVPDGLDLPAPIAPDMTPQIAVPPTLNWPVAPVLEPVSMPSPPIFDEVATPTKPVVSTDLAVPDAPELNLPALPYLDDIHVPSFVALEFPTFDEDAPGFTAAAPNPVIDWAEPVYESENFNEALAVLQRMRIGGTGLPPAIEQAIYERGRARLDRTTAKSVAEVIDSYASRGFVAPPGAMFAAIASVREEAALQSNALSRDVLIQATEIQVENMRFAVTQGLAAEQILVNLFSNATQRTFEMARFTVETSLNLYNAQINVFNALMQAFQTKASVFKVLTDAKLATLEQQKLELEAARVRGELNQQRVTIYREQVQATLSEVELYKARLQGVQAKAEIVKTVFDGYRAEVQGFAEAMNARKVQADIFRTQVEAETSKIKIGEAKASIFTALSAAESTKVNAFKDYAQVEIARVGAVAAAYGHTVESFKAEVGRATAKVNAVLELKKTSLQAESIRNTATIEAVKATQALGELKLQTQVAKANTTIKLLDVNITKISAQAELRARSLQALGQMAATLAGGAMSAQHVSAGISASAGETSSIQRSESVQNTLSQSA